MMFLERRCVTPFYLKMMGTGAAGGRVPFRSLGKVARKTSDDEVATLLASDWRRRVMGAWFAAGREYRLEGNLLKSLETSGGAFTAIPLATVALRGLGTRAAPALYAYLWHDLENRWGAASFVAAVLECLGAPPDGVLVSRSDREVLDRMLTVAARIAEASVVSPVRPGAR